jgi:hypothetical protein
MATQKFGQLRWNANKGFYQIYTMIATPLGFPLPAWIKAPDQEKAKMAMGSGFSNMEAYNKAAQQGAAGQRAPHEGMQLPEAAPSSLSPAAGMLPVATAGDYDMTGCPCPKEHDYEAAIQDTGIRPLYRTVVTVPAGVAGQLVLTANDKGAIDKLAIFATDNVTFGNAERQVTIPGAIQLNSKSLDFAENPAGTVLPWAQISPDGIGREIGRLELVKTDAFTIPLFNNGVNPVVVEAFGILNRGRVPQAFLRR